MKEAARDTDARTPRTRALDPLYSFKDLSTATGIPRPTLYTLAARGELKTIRIGRSRRVTPAEWTRFLAAHLEEGSQ